jgi:ParB-like chromosome segregation protein Spo0J
VEWVPTSEVAANDYNPNSVAPPEMELLRLSIMADGYTQPIVTNIEKGNRVVVDGFHRNRVGREMPDVAARIHGYLPVVQIRTERTSRSDRMASTIRHNRARGKHQVTAMSDIVIELKRRNWSNDKIGRELGMDADEVLRLCQMTGLAELFADESFSDSWDVDDLAESDDEAIAEIAALIVEGGE